MMSRLKLQLLVAQLSYQRISDTYRVRAATTLIPHPPHPRTHNGRKEHRRFVYRTMRCHHLNGNDTHSHPALDCTVNVPSQVSINTAPLGALLQLHPIQRTVILHSDAYHLSSKWINWLVLSYQYAMRSYDEIHYEPAMAFAVCGRWEAKDFRMSHNASLAPLCLPQKRQIAKWSEPNFVAFVARIGFNSTFRLNKYEWHSRAPSVLSIRTHSRSTRRRRILP